jgi:hypothetical protein
MCSIKRFVCSFCNIIFLARVGLESLGEVDWCTRRGWWRTWHEVVWREIYYDSRVIIVF